MERTRPREEETTDIENTEDVSPTKKVATISKSIPSAIRPYITKRVINKNMKYGDVINRNIRLMKGENDNLKQTKAQIEKRLEELQSEYDIQKQQFDAASEEVKKLKEGLSITNKERQELEALRNEIDNLKQTNDRDWVEVNNDLEREATLLEEMLAFIDVKEPEIVLKNAIYDMLTDINVNTTNLNLDNYNMTQLKGIFTDLNILRSKLDSKIISPQKFLDGLKTIFAKASK